MTAQGGQRRNSLADGRTAVGVQLGTARGKQDLIDESNYQPIAELLDLYLVGGDLGLQLPAQRHVLLFESDGILRLLNLLVVGLLRNEAVSAKAPTGMASIQCLIMFANS